MDVAYETYGELNARRNNAILVLHAFTGDAHAAGTDKISGTAGWWDSMIGPGKGFDTDKYFVICSNILGGCRGTSGPGSSIRKPAALTGCLSHRHHPRHGPVSEIAGRSPGDRTPARGGGRVHGRHASSAVGRGLSGRYRSSIPIAGTARHSPQQIAFNEVGRQAIMADLDWNEGDYYGKRPPARGLAVARMVGHITYMSDASMREKFGRRLRDQNQFEVESYLRYRAVNSWTGLMRILISTSTRLWIIFDLTAGRPR